MVVLVLLRGLILSAVPGLSTLGEKPLANGSNARGSEWQDEEDSAKGIGASEPDPSLFRGRAGRASEPGARASEGQELQCAV